MNFDFNMSIGYFDLVIWGNTENNFLYILVYINTNETVMSIYFCEIRSLSYGKITIHKLFSLNYHVEFLDMLHSIVLHLRYTK